MFSFPEAWEIEFVPLSKTHGMVLYLGFTEHSQKITYLSSQYQNTIFLVTEGASADYQFHRQYQNIFGDC
jgi:hypothetical protein